MNVSVELERLRKRIVMAGFKAPFFLHLPRATKSNDEKYRLRWTDWKPRFEPFISETLSSLHLHYIHSHMRIAVLRILRKVGNMGFTKCQCV